MSSLQTIDIADHADRIARSAAKVVDAVLARRAVLDRGGRKNLPLFVLAGENHDFPAHSIHHMKVLAELQKRKCVIVCIEQQHNSILEIFSHCTGHLPSKTVINDLRVQDRNGVLSLKTDFAFRESPFADQSRRILQRFLWEHRILTRYIDAAKIRHANINALDVKDPSTFVSLKACFAHVAKNVEFQSTSGVFVRNHHMSAEAQRFALEQKADIVFLTMGFAHVMGNSGLGLKGKQSLAALLNAQGLPVLAIPYYNLGKNNPRVRWLTKNEKLLGLNIPNISAQYGDFPKTWMSKADLTDRVEESLYSNMLLASLDLSPDILYVGEYQKMKNCLFHRNYSQFSSIA